MQMKLFTIPVIDPLVGEEEINLFLRTHKVLEVNHEFFQTKDGAVWCFCVKYIEGGIPDGKGKFFQPAKIDYKNVLDEKCFAIFSILRECRKQIAQEEAIPPYAVFIDEELAGIAKLETITEQTITSIDGIGKRKAERFGKRILQLLVEKQTVDKEIQREK